MTMRRLLWLSLPISLGLIGATAWHGYDCGWMGDRMPLSCVRWSNLSAFKAQLVRDLPVGTSQEAVEKYLAREGIPFSYDFPRHPSYRKPILIEKEISGDWTNWFAGWAQLFVVFDRDGNVAEFDFREQRK